MQYTRQPKQYTRHPKRIHAAALTLALALLLAGCTAPIEPPAPPSEPDDATHTDATSNPTAPTHEAADETATDDADDAPAPPPSDSDADDEAQDASPADPDDPPQEEEHPQRDGPAWPALADAVLRPGVRLHPAGEPCTTSFLFRSPDNTTLYLAAAASCLKNHTLGDPIALADGAATGTLAYSGWMNGTTLDPMHGHDFALIAIDDADRALVHPAVLHHGGPTALAVTPTAGLTDGERVLWYGNASALAADGLTPYEGYVCAFMAAALWFLPAGAAHVQDIGGPVMHANGSALGLVTKVTPFCGPSVGVQRIPVALDEARERGMEIELVTWPLLGPGTLPDNPLP